MTLSCNRCGAKIKAQLLAVTLGQYNSVTVVLGWFCPECDFNATTVVTSNGYTVDYKGNEIRFN